MALTIEKLQHAKAIFDAAEKAERAYAERVRKIVSRLSYKPNWTFAIQDTPDLGYGTVALMIASEVIEIESGRLDKLRGSVVLNPITEDTEEMIVLSIAHKIQSMEIHEFREWLKVDGKRVQEPHPKDESMAGDSVRADQVPSRSRR